MEEGAEDDESMKQDFNVFYLNFLSLALVIWNLKTRENMAWVLYFQAKN